MKETFCLNLKISSSQDIDISGEKRQQQQFNYCFQESRNLWNRRSLLRLGHSHYENRVERKWCNPCVHGLTGTDRENIKPGAPLFILYRKCCHIVHKEMFKTYCLYLLQQDSVTTKLMYYCHAMIIKRQFILDIRSRAWKTGSHFIDLTTFKEARNVLFVTLSV